MDTKEISREQISALADGELVDSHVSMALAVLRQPEEQVTWDLYHQIGDVMRSEEMAFSLSDGFAAKMSARLDAEPTIIAPQLTTTAAEQIIVPVAVNDATASNVVSLMPARKRFVRRFVMPGAAAAAAIVAVVLVTGQQQSTTVASAPAPTVSTVATVSVPSAITNVAATSSMQQGTASISSLAQQGEVARDPRIDDYHRLPSAPDRHLVRANAAGYLTNLDAELIGRACVILGAGRDRVEDPIDHSVGIMLMAKPGDQLSKGDAILELHYHDAAKRDRALELANRSFTIGAERPAPRTVIVGEVH